MRSKIETDLLMGELVYKYLRGEISADEQELLDSWLSNEENKAFFLSLKNSDRLYEGMVRRQYIDTEVQFKKLQGKIRQKRHARLWPRLAGIAALLVMGLGVALLWRMEQQPMQVPQARTLPLEDRTRLHTAEGQLVYLADSVKEIFAHMDTRVEPQQGYRPDTPVVAENVKYNVLATSSHGQIEMMLSDSSRVWLNAGSELRYPDVFGKDERKVYLKGEAYFEVSKNVHRPFIVHAGGAEVEVLGTEFNVKNRGEDACETTLVEGRVQMRNGAQEPVLLLPGQQGEIRADGIIQVREVDVRYAIAWKQNRFAFHEQSLFHILKELSEWYDFSFEFENMRLANLVYTAIVPRCTTVYEVLQILQRTGDFVCTEAEGKHIVIQEKESGCYNR